MDILQTKKKNWNNPCKETDRIDNKNLIKAA